MVLELERASDSAGGLLKQIAGARSAVSDLVRLGRVAKKIARYRGVSSEKRRPPLCPGSQRELF